MRYSFVWLCLLAACSSPPKAEPIKPQLSTEAAMRQLLTEIERPGRHHEIDASEYFARPDSLAMLLSAYERSDGAWTRWKLLRLVRKTRSQQAQAFLKAEALKPIPRATPTPMGLAETTGNEEYVNRLEAALGVLEYMPGSESDVEEIIATVDTAISRVLASELFIRGQLTTALTAALQRRSLPTEFRDLSESEERALMSAEPSRWGKEGQP